MNDHSDALINDKVQKILHFYRFFHDIEIVSQILILIKIAILQLEKREYNMTNCFLQLIHLAVSFYNYLMREK